MVIKLPLTLFLLLLAATVSVASEIKVATINCFLLFDPRIDHWGKLDDEQRLSVGCASVNYLTCCITIRQFYFAHVIAVHPITTML